MAHTSDINQTFIIEPIFVTGDTPVISACTALYTDAIIACSGNTQIIMGNGIISFDGNLYTDNDLTATTINASTYFSGGTNLLDIFGSLNNTYITGGTFNNINDTLTLNRNDNVNINVTGFTDYYTTGATLIGSTVYFNRTDLLSAYTLNLSGLIVQDTYVTGVTFSNNQLIIGRNDGVNLNTFINTFTGLTISGNLSATTYYGNGSNLTGIPNIYVTGGTYNNPTGTATFTNSTGGTFSVNGFTTGSTNFDIYTTGATYSNGFVYFNRNDILSAYTLDIRALTGDTNTFVTGGTLNVDTLELKRNDDVQINIDLSSIRYSGGSAHCISEIYVTNVYGCSPITIHDTIRAISGLSVTGTTNSDIISATTISATTFYVNGNQLIGDTNTFVTGGTPNNSTKIYTFTNSTGGTFNVTGLTDITITGGSYNNPTGTISLVNTTGGTITISGFVTGDTNTFVTGGTYTNGTATFTNSTGGTFNVSGFLTGTTDTYVTGFTYSPITNLLSINQTNQTPLTQVINSFNNINITGLTVTNDILLKNNLTLNGDAMILGNVTILGTATTINTQTLSVNDNLITLNNTATGNTSPFLIDSGIEVLRNSATTASLIWNETNMQWEAGLTGTTYGIITKNSSLSNLAVTAHTHPINEIIGLQSNLNNKLDLTGGTLTGSLVLPTISATTYLNLPTTNNIFVSAGTANNSTKVYTFVNTSGGTFNVIGLTDITITSGTYSNGITTLTNNTGGTITISGYVISDTNTFVTGATYNNPTGTLTFTNSTGGTFTTTGFTTGSTSGVDVYETGITNSNNVITLTNNTGGTISTLINTLTGLTVNGILSGTTIYTDGITGFTGTNLLPYKIYSSAFRGGMGLDGNERYTFETNQGFYNFYHSGGNNYSQILGASYTRFGDSNNLTTNTNAYINVAATTKAQINLFSGATNLLPTSGDIWNDGTYINIYSGVKSDTISATTYLNLPSSTSIYTTGITNSNNNIILTNNTGGTISTLINTLTGLTINGVLSGTSIRTNGLTAFTTTTSTPFIIDSGGGMLVSWGVDGNNRSTFNTSQGLYNFYYNTGTYAQIFGQFYTQFGESSNLTTNLNAYINIAATNKAQINLFSGASNISPTNGDMWNDGTYINFYPRIKSDTVSATTYLNLPATNNIFVSAGTANNSTKVYTFTNTSGGTFNVSGLTDITITGGTYSNGTATFTNNTGGTITITGFSTTIDTNTFVTGATTNNSTKIYTFTNSTGGTFNVTGLTDISITSANYNNSIGTITLTNNTGGTVTASGFVTGDTNTFVTGATTNNSTKVYTFTNSTGGTFNVTGLTDIYVSAATYNNPTGTITFTNNTGGTFTSTGFVTGDTNTYVTGGTANDSTKVYTFTNSTGGTFNVSALSDIRVTGGTYTNGIATFTNSTGGTFSVNGFVTNDTNTFVTGGTANNSTKVYTFTNSTGGTFNVTGLTDIYLTGGTYSNPTGTLTLTNSTGGTFSVNGFTTGSTNPNDVFVTGGTANNSTKIYTFTNSTGGTFNVTGLTDITITGFTANDSTKIYTLTNSTGGTITVTALTDVNVTAFTANDSLKTYSITNNTGGTLTVNALTDVNTTGVTFTNNLLSINNNTGGTSTVLINTMTGLTVAGTVSATTLNSPTILSGGTNINTLYLPSQAYSGLTKITVSTTAPSSPSIGDLWVDTN